MKCQDFKGSQGFICCNSDIISAAQRDQKNGLHLPNSVSNFSLNFFKHLQKPQSQHVLSSNLDFFLQGHVSCTALSPSDATLHPDAETRSQHHPKPIFHRLCQGNYNDFNWSPMYTKPHSTQKVPSKGRVEQISSPVIKIFQRLSMLLNKDQTPTVV